MGPSPLGAKNSGVMGVSPLQSGDGTYYINNITNNIIVDKQGGAAE